MNIFDILLAILRFAAQSAASGTIGNRADDAVRFLGHRSGKDELDRLAKQLGDSSGISIDPDGLRGWFDDHEVLQAIGAALTDPTTAANRTVSLLYEHGVVSAGTQREKVLEVATLLLPAMYWMIPDTDRQTVDLIRELRAGSEKSKLSDQHLLDRVEVGIQQCAEIGRSLAGVRWEVGTIRRQMEQLRRSESNGISVVIVQEADSVPAFVHDEIGYAIPSPNGIRLPSLEPGTFSSWALREGGYPTSPSHVRFILQNESRSDVILQNFRWASLESIHIGRVVQVGRELAGDVVPRRINVDLDASDPRVTHYLAEDGERQPLELLLKPGEMEVLDVSAISSTAVRWTITADLVMGGGSSVFDLGAGTNLYVTPILDTDEFFSWIGNWTEVHVSTEDAWQIPNGTRVPGSVPKPKL